MSSTEDHALGLELQLIELVEQQERARLQHRDADVAAVQAEIVVLQEELAAMGEAAEAAQPGRAQFHDAQRAGRSSGSAA